MTKKNDEKINNPKKINNSEKNKHEIYKIEYLKRGFRTISVIETIIYIAIVYLIGIIINPEDPFFSEWSLHPYFAICFLIPMRYGLGESASASLICSLILGYIIYSRADTDFFSWIDCYSTFKVPLLMTCFSIFGGYIREEALEREKSVEDTLKALLQKKDKMDKRLGSTEKALVELETRILSSESDVLDHIRDFTYFYFEEMGEVVDEMTKSLRNFTDAGEVIFAYIENDKIVSAVKRTKDNKSGPCEQMDIGVFSNDPIVQETLRTKLLSKISDCLTSGVYNNFNDFCIITVPVLDRTGKFIGLAGIKKLPFINFTPYTIKITSTMVRLWQTAFAQYFLRKQLEMDVLFDKILRIGTHKHLIDHMESEFERHEKLNYNLVIGIFEIIQRDKISDKKLMFLEKIIVELIESQGIKRDNIYRFCHRACFAIFSDDGTTELVENAIKYSASEFEKLGFEASENNKISCNYYIYKRDLDIKDFSVYLKNAYKGLKTPSKLQPKDTKLPVKEIGS